VLAHGRTSVLKTGGGFIVAHQGVNNMSKELKEKIIIVVVIVIGICFVILFNKFIAGACRCPHIPLPGFGF